MSGWGRNDQAVTANSTTTIETSNGAPIGTFAFVKGDQVNRLGGANAHFGNTSIGSRAYTDVNMFTNTTPSAFIPNMAVGVFGVTAPELSTNNVPGSNASMITHAGWALRKAFTGPVVNITYSGTATGYNNTDILTVASNTAGGNATASMSTNSTGGALAITITNAGSGFLLKTPTVAYTNATGGTGAGSGATFVATAGGRAGRVQWETLVAMGTVGAQSAVYGTPANVANTGDQGILPPG